MTRRLSTRIILTLQSSLENADSVQMLLTVVILIFSHFSISVILNCTLCSCSLFLAHPKVLQYDMLLDKMDDFSFGKQIGLTKSDINTPSSSFTIAIVLPSTGDLTRPTILLSCCHGEVPDSRTVPNLAVHSALGCPWKQEAVVTSQSGETNVPSQTWTSSLKRAACQGQSPCPDILLRICMPFWPWIVWRPHSRSEHST